MHAFMSGDEQPEFNYHNTFYLTPEMCGGREYYVFFFFFLNEMKMLTNGVENTPGILPQESSENEHPIAQVRAGILSTRNSTLLCPVPLTLIF